MKPISVKTTRRDPARKAIEDLTELLQRCDKNALVGVVKRLCVKMQGILVCYVNLPTKNNGELDSEDVKTIIRESMNLDNHSPPSTMEHLDELLHYKRSLCLF
jgi:hypothetical protein